MSQQSSKFFMAFLDRDSLFTNVQLDKIIDACVKELLKTNQTVSSLPKQRVRKNAFINYRRKHYT